MVAQTEVARRWHYSVARCAFVVLVCEPMPRELAYPEPAVSPGRLAPVWLSELSAGTGRLAGCSLTHPWELLAAPDVRELLQRVPK